MRNVVFKHFRTMMTLSDSVHFYFLLRLRLWKILMSVMINKLFPYKHAPVKQRVVSYKQTFDWSLNVAADLMSYYVSAHFHMRQNWRTDISPFTCSLYVYYTQHWNVAVIIYIYFFLTELTTTRTYNISSYSSIYQKSFCSHNNKIRIVMLRCQIIITKYQVRNMRKCLYLIKREDLEIKRKQSH